MQYVYNVEMNIASILLLMLVRFQTRHKTEQLSTARLIFNNITWAAALVCAADIAAGFFQGRPGVTAKVLLEFFNLFYLEEIVAIGFLWMLYVDCRLKAPTAKRIRQYRIWGIPLIAFTAALLSNPVTHLFFSIDADNHYKLQGGMALFWALVWAQLALPVGWTIRAILHEKNKLRQMEIHPLVYYVAAPAAALALQMRWFELRSAQIGITVSILMISMEVQGSQILTDALTGLNNRRGLDNYLSDHIQRHQGDELALLMIDINHFKRINDQFGHTAGDMALKEISEDLKRACCGVPVRPYLCRYGGDEFVIASIGGPGQEQKLMALIHAEIEKNADPAAGFRLSVSIGSAAGKCSDLDDAGRLLARADRAMYEQKLSHPNAGNVTV